MPNYRSITIALRSQYDISTIPEFDPPDPELTNARYFSNTPYVSSAPKAVDGTTSTVSVYIPIYPSSQFWICYDISPPAPPAAYFLFKLLINGAHVVSWSCGQEDAWRGKTMFGLFESPEDKEGKGFVERRSLFFSDAKKSVGSDPSSRLVNAGRAKKENPKRFHRFSLIDPIDQPFATFKYYYCTQKKLEELGILGRQNGYDSATLSGLLGTATHCSISLEQKRENFDAIGEDDAPQSEHEGDNGYSVPSPVLETHLSHCDSPYERGITKTPKYFYRLSIPPSLKLVPLAPSSQPVCPRKLTPNASMASLVELPSPEATWLQRTPSPVKSVRTELQSPP